MTTEISPEKIPGMVTLDDIYDEICSYEGLYQSHLEARKGKRYRDDVLVFTDRLEENLIELQNELIWQTYKVGKYRQFYVREPKLRLVMALQYRDRIVQWAIYRQLYPFYDKMFIEDSYACRRGKGSHKAADKLQYWLRQVSRKPGKWYYLKLDISKYFYRVDHLVLLEILSRRIKDPRLFQLLREIINSEDTRFGLPAGVSPDECPEEDWLSDVGMPIGNLTSQLFANIYLNELDQLEEILRDNDVDYLFYGMGCKNTVYEELLNRIPDQALPCLKKRIPLETDPSDKWYRRDLFPETVSDE